MLIMDVVLGFLAGYLFASKFGLLDLDKTKGAWKVIRKSKEAQAILAAGFDIFRQTLMVIAKRR